MKIDIHNLPSDTNVLQQIVTDLVDEVIFLNNKNESLEGQNTSLQEQMVYLQAQLTLLKKKRFGKSSEKLDNQIAELESKIEEGELLEAAFDTKQKDEEDDSLAEKKDEKKNIPKREKLPEHLERIDEVLNPDPKCPECGNEEFRKIADDVSETLEYIPSSFKVIRHIRPRCVCINCEKVVQAYPSSKPIAKGMAGAGLLAHIIVQKYCNHLPFYRQSEIYDREGIDLSRSTMASWAGQCSALLEPLIEKIKESIFSSTHIHGDDTPVKVLAPGLGKTKTGRIWTYVRDGRKYGDNTPPAVCYFYSPDRKGIRPAEHLKSFSGILHADAYSGYDNLYINGTKPDTEVISKAKITEAACWAHTRRKFYEVTVTNSNANIAMRSLEEIRQIYEIEESISGLDHNKRYKFRQKQSKELVEKLFISWKKCYKGLPKKSATGLAIAYALNNEVALKRFLSDGKVEIDNNASERALRTIALGRKNWLFAGSDGGGATAAAIYTITETAKLNEINPWSYLREVLLRIQDHNSTKISELLPWNLKLP
jgi:transposase